MSDVELSTPEATRDFKRFKKAMDIKHGGMCKESPDGNHCFHTLCGEALYAESDPLTPIGEMKQYVCCFCGEERDGGKKYFNVHGTFQPSWEQEGSGYRPPEQCGHEVIE